MTVWRVAAACAALVASAAVQAQAERADHELVPAECRPQQPRFPARYAKYRELRAAAKAERDFLLRLAAKDAETSMYIEATVYELDLTGDGVCDNVVVVSDPINTGGDRDVLATVYLAGKGRWQRVGARSAAKSDRPSDINTITSPADHNYEFDSFAALRRPGQMQAPTYLVAWHFARVANGFSGYRVFEIDPAAATLRSIDKWNGEGAQVYSAFKRFKDTRGIALFEPEVETLELGELCEHITESNSGLAAECRQRKR